MSLRISASNSSIFTFASAMALAFSSSLCSHQQAYLSYDFCSIMPSPSILALSSVRSVTTFDIGDWPFFVAASTKAGRANAGLDAEITNNNANARHNEDFIAVDWA